MSSKKRSTKFLGQTISYKTVAELNKKSGIDKKDLNIIKSDIPIERIIYNKDGDFQRVNLREKPLVLREFGVSKLTKDAKQNLLKNFQKGLKLNKDNFIYKSIDSNTEVNLVIELLISWVTSEDARHKKFVLYVNIKPKDIDKYCREYGINWLTINLVPHEPDSYEYEYKIKSRYSNQEFELINDRLKEEKPLNIFNSFVNVELNNNKDCAINYLLNKLPQYEHQIRKLNKDGVKIADIITFCNKYNISFKIYKINGEIYMEKINKSRYSIIFLAYNHHLYPVKNDYLEKRKISKVTINIVDDCISKLNEFLNKNILPHDITTNGTEIISFIVDDIKYLQNEDYNKCLEILNKYGLGDKITDTIKLPSVFNIIEGAYLKDNVNSFWINHNQFSKSGFIFQKKLDNKRNIVSIDKNKMYPYCLKQLRFLIKTDYRTNTINIKPTEIIPHYLYIANPKQSSILMNNLNVYSGEHLLYCKKEGLEFELLEEMTCDRINNYYNQMIEDLYKQVINDDFKKISVIGIGSFEQSAEIKQYCKTEGLFDEKDSKYYNGYDIKVNDKYKLRFDKVDKVSNIYTKKPIAIQIKDESTRVLYEKMKELKIKSEDVINIKIDSITYYGKLPTDLNKNDFNGWKEIDNKIDELEKIQDNDIVNQEKLSFILKQNEEDKIFSRQKTYLAKCYAGVGKTFYIKNKLLKDINDFIILTPSHVSLEEFKDVNCDVIQKYTFKNIIPKEKNIIIDEVGMCDKEAHDLIYKCFMLGKNIYAFGDFNQLPPVGYPSLSSNHYLDFLFTEKIELVTNMRNDFTKEYYDSLINENVNLQEEIIKYQTDYTNAEMVICWRNKTVDKYNKLIMKQKKIKKYDDGLKLLCYSNNLGKHEIYNKFEYTIKSSDEETVTLDNDITLKKKHIDKYFKPAFARTVYAVQGKSLKSYHYADEDLYVVDGKIAYVVISRLKTKNHEQIKQIENKIEIDFFNF